MKKITILTLVSIPFLCGCQFIKPSSKSSFSFSSSSSSSAHEHIYTCTYTWNEDNTSCVANAICECGSSVSENGVVTNKDGHIKVIFTNRIFTTQYKGDHVFPVEEYYDGYYSSISTWTNSEDLINQLHNLIKNDTKLKYEQNWLSNRSADQALDDFESVDVVYGDVNLLKEDKWDREHAFCASLMTSLSTGDAIKYLGRATDFHNLFASNSSGNRSRGNKNFGIADKSSSGYVDKGAYSYDKNNFEPSDYDKGRLSRAIFYMSVMYNQESESDYRRRNFQGDYITYGPASIKEELAYPDDVSTNPHYIGNFSTLLNWATSFDVDRLEYQHCNSVYSLDNTDYYGRQGNRNPFVDYPDLIDYCFGDKKDEAGDLNLLEPTFFTLDLDSKDHANYAIKTAKRTYIVGESFLYNDIKLVDVFKDYSFVDIEELFTSTLNNGYVFLDSDIGKKEITLTIDNQVIKYYATISEE